MKRIKQQNFIILFISINELQNINIIQKRFAT
jgi:hypothetical protein